MDMQVFNSPEGQEIRVVDQNGEPWFVASDLAKALGYRDAANMTRRLDDYDRGTRLMSTPSGDQQMTIISEAGMYAAILGSEVGGAKAFKRWVTHDVLPEIRRTGAYGRKVSDPVRDLSEMEPETLDHIADSLHRLAVEKRLLGRLLAGGGAVHHRAKRVPEGGLASRLRSWAASAPAETTTEEALAAVGEENNRAHQVLAGVILQSSGYTRQRLRKGLGRMYVYSRA